MKRSSEMLQLWTALDSKLQQAATKLSTQTTIFDKACSDLLQLTPYFSNGQYKTCFKKLNSHV